MSVEPGAIVHDPYQLPDVAATLLEATGARYPTEQNGTRIHPLEGVSFLPLFENQNNGRGPLFFEHEGKAAIRDGKWKLVKNFTGASSATPGFDPAEGRGDWELYDMEKDRTELRDLASSEPGIVARMAAEYRRWAERCGVKDREKILAYRAKK